MGSTQIFLTCFSAMLLLSQCVTPGNRKMLSFFFDGVPAPRQFSEFKSNTQPDSTVVQEKMTKETAVINGTQYVHPVYQKKDCESCHEIENAYRLKQRQPELCYQCHKNYSDRYTVLHGPVAAGFCTACHEAHQSKFDKLLKMEIREACQFCHSVGDISKNEAHQKASEKLCVDCHHAHGGETRNMLKSNEEKVTE